MEGLIPQVLNSLATKGTKVHEGNLETRKPGLTALERSIRDGRGLADLFSEQ
jgi:hypothetical protein